MRETPKNRMSQVKKERERERERETRPSVRLARFRYQRVYFFPCFIAQEFSGVFDTG